jgi:hypothetical protein
VTLLAPFTALLAAAGLFADAPGIQVINISFDRQCEHEVDTSKTAKKRDRDVVIWRIASKCKDAQELTIKPKNLDPFVGCVGDPRAFKIGSRFTINGTTADEVTAYAVCTVDWGKAGTHKFKVDLTHRATSPEPIGTRDHELALEVVP